MVITQELRLGVYEPHETDGPTARKITCIALPFVLSDALSDQIHSRVIAASQGVMWPGPDHTTVELGHHPSEDYHLKTLRAAHSIAQIMEGGVIVNPDLYLVEDGSDLLPRRIAS